MINKIAQPSYWPKVVQKVLTLGLRPEIVAMLNNFNQIVWEASPPSGNPNAVAYVSSEDMNDDGKIDKIHFVSSNFPPNANDEEIDGIVGQVAKTLVHEYGHIDDFDPDKKTFPGGEGVAEAAERAAEGMINQKLQLAASENTTNKKNRIDNTIESDSFKKVCMQKELVTLANHLDNIGHKDLADRVDEIIKSANSPTDLSVEVDTSSGQSSEAEEETSFEGYVQSAKDAMDMAKEWVINQFREEGKEPVGTAFMRRVLDKKNEILLDLEKDDDNWEEPVESSDETQEAKPHLKEVEAASESMHDRINKLAELMSREFTNVPRSFTR